MKVVIVDENDIPTGLKERDQWDDGEIHRVSALWVNNSQGEYLIAQRALSKNHAPGKWGPAVAGTVEEGETYETNIIKETKEEIGVQISLEQLRTGPKYLIGPARNRRFTQWYFATLDVPRENLVLPPDEVMDARWISRDELKSWLTQTPEDFIGTAPSTFPLLMNQ